MSGWATAELADLAGPGGITDGPFGSNLKTEHYTERGPRVIRLQNIGDTQFIDAKAHISAEHFERLRKHEARMGDLVVALLGDVLPRVCVVPQTLGPAIVKADCARVRVDEQVASPKYVCFALSREQLRRQIAEIVHGVGRPRITLRELKVLEIPLAPRMEQDRIVAAIEEQLSRVEAGVDVLERVKKELARYRASVLNAACEGRLVPTEATLARAEGRSYEPASELLARILAERRARWDRKKKYAEPTPPDTSSFPALPEGWVWATVEQLSWDSGYGTSQRCDYDGPGVPVLRIPNVSKARLDLTALKRLVGRGESIEQGDFVAPGDLLVVRTNGSRDLIGRAAVVEAPPALECYFASYLIRFRLCSGTPTWRFVSLYWQSPEQRQNLESRAATSAGQYNISQAKLEVLAIPLPPLAEQHRIVAEVERRLSIADEVTTTVDSALVHAARLRQSILKRAFEGKLVPQDPNDEPASVLLARIRAEREAAAETRPRRNRGKAATGSVAASSKAPGRRSRRKS